MRTTLLLALLGLAACTLVLAVPIEFEQQLRQPRMSDFELEAYHQYLLEQQIREQEAYEIDFESQQAVECPVGTRGLSIPPAHVAFWKQHELTKKLKWSGANDRFMCVPARLRHKLTPIITKLKVARMIKVDPLTDPVLMRDIGTIDVVDRDVDTIEAEMQLQSIMEQMRQAELEQMGIYSESDSDFDVQGPGRFGRGFGWGGKGFGKGFGGFGGLGWGFPGFGLGLGLGVPLGLGFGGWGLNPWGFGGLGGFPGGFGWGW